MARGRAHKRPSWPSSAVVELTSIVHPSHAAAPCLQVQLEMRKKRISRGGPTMGTMVQRSLMLRSACSAPRGEKLRAPRSRNMGSETPEFQSMSYGDAQKLRSLEGQPRVAEGAGEHPSQLLRVPVRHGLIIWSLRPQVSTAKWSQFLSPWPETCRTRRRRSLDHRIAAQQLIHVCCS